MEIFILAASSFESLLGQGFMAGQQLSCCAVAIGKEDAAVGDSWAVRHLPSHPPRHRACTGHHHGVKVTQEESFLCNLASRNIFNLFWVNLT